MAIAKAGEINLEYYTEGSGPPLLLIMGFAGSADTWGQPFLDALKRDFTITRFSNRGTGLSDDPEAAMTVRLMADDTVALLDALGTPKTHVLGISMGGMIAQEMAINYPQRVGGLVLGCTSAGFAHGQPASPETVALMAPAAGLAPADLIRRSWGALVSDGFVQSGHDFLEDMIVRILRKGTPLDTMARQMAAIAGFDAFERDGSIRAPVRVIHGDVDRLVPPANGEVLAGAIPGAELRIVRGAAHMFFWEKPEESAQLVREFLARVAAGV